MNNWDKDSLTFQFKIFTIKLLSKASLLKKKKVSVLALAGEGSVAFYE